MKFYATLCAVALVLEVCSGQSAPPQLETPSETPATPEALFRQGLESLPCENFQHVENIIYTKVTQVIDDSERVEPWFPHNVENILNNLNNTILIENRSNLTLLVKLASEFDDMLNKAVVIASDNIDMNSRIDADYKMTALLQAVPDTFKDPIVISKACQIAKEAAVTAYNLQNWVGVCELSFKNFVVPDFITEDLKTLSEKIESIGTDSEDDSTFAPLINEVVDLYNSVSGAFESDKDRPKNAGHEFASCISPSLEWDKRELDDKYNEMKDLIPSQILVPVLAAKPASSPPADLSVPLRAIPLAPAAAPSMPVPIVPVA